MSVTFGPGTDISDSNLGIYSKFLAITATYKLNVNKIFNENFLILCLVFQIILELCYKIVI